MPEHQDEIQSPESTGTAELAGKPQSEIDALRSQLATVEYAYSLWEDSSFTRRDGSMAQDARFEARGNDLQQEITQLKAAIRKLES